MADVLVIELVFFCDVKCFQDSCAGILVHFAEGVVVVVVRRAQVRLACSKPFGYLDV